MSQQDSVDNKIEKSNIHCLKKDEGNNCCNEIIENSESHSTELVTDDDFVVDDDEEIETEEIETEENETEESGESENDDFIVDDDEEEDKILLIINKAKIRKQMLSNTVGKRKSCENEKETGKNKKNKYCDILKKYSNNEKKHFQGVDDVEKEKLYDLEKQLECGRFDEQNQPLRFKILKMDIPNNVKNILLSKLEQYNKMTPGSGEYCKLENWLSTLSKIPIGKYHQLPITKGEADIQKYLQNVKDSFDKSIFGHNETKEQIIRILAQWVSNPKSCGYVIGIHGSPGVGKTKLIKTCISNAMQIPLSFVSLGGVSDSAYLNGHNYTYEGSTYGKITECLIKSNVMNPVFLFDELDKVSNTSRGEEIINVLIHITDPVQNDKYTDKYFEEVDLDLSKSLIIFTYNDENLINPVLKDRMITIKVPGYNSNEKLSICKDYIIPELLTRYNLKTGDIIFEDALLKSIIENNKDDGVRTIKHIINDCISWVNMMKYIPTDNIQVSFPFNVSSEFFKKYCEKTKEKNQDILLSMYT